MNKYEYQYGFSEAHPDALYNLQKRTQKAKKVLSVLSDYKKNLETLSLLDIGCSTGIMTKVYGEKFGKVIGIDIDRPAVEFAICNNSSANIQYFVKDGMDTGFHNESFDVITCTMIYEHVPDYNKLMSEIYRLLKLGGVCYFGAHNRLNLMEAHYKLPFLSIIPKPLAHIYLRILRKGNFYYENHLTLWGLRKLVSEFEIIDYTRKIIEEPQKYFATEMVLPGSFKQKVALTVFKTAYWLFPTYIWLLRKRRAD